MNVKGTRDFLPKQKIMRDTVIDILKKTFTLYGFSPIETPCLELEETLCAKYAGGSEITKEIFTLTDNAQRKLGLRYDLTVPFARVIASNPQLKKPFKRYHIDKVWRNGPIKLGRYREFYQCDCDIVGSSSLVTDAELLSLVHVVFEQLQLPSFVVRVNNKKILDACMKQAHIPDEMHTTVLLSIDKLLKIGKEGVQKELAQKQLTAQHIEALQPLLQPLTLEQLKALLSDTTGVQELEDVFRYATLFGCTKVVFDNTLARGLTYYTGTIWEVFLQDSPVTSSVASGGRYDNMIGDMIGAKQQMPAVGTSFGLDVICDALKEHAQQTLCDMYVICLGNIEQCIPMIQALRTQGISVDMDVLQRSLSKNVEYAHKYGIGFVCIIGEDELRLHKVTIKHLVSGKQDMMDVSAVKSWMEEQKKSER